MSKHNLFNYHALLITTVLVAQMVEVRIKYYTKERHGSAPSTHYPLRATEILLRSFAYQLFKVSGYAIKLFDNRQLIR